MATHFSFSVSGFVGCYLHHRSRAGGIASAAAFGSPHHPWAGSSLAYAATAMVSKEQKRPMLRALIESHVSFFSRIPTQIWQSNLAKYCTSEASAKHPLLCAKRHSALRVRERELNAQINT